MKSDLELEIKSLDELRTAAESLIKFADNTRILLVSGPMGAGKTTLIKAICSSLGSKDHFSSPTFSIVNEYQYPGGKIFHFDLYRLKDSSELFDLGIEEYLDSGEFCLVEWPEMMLDMIEDNYLEIHISSKGSIRYIRSSHKRNH